MSYDENYIKNTIDKYANFNINNIKQTNSNRILVKTLSSIQNRMESAYDDIKAFVNNITGNDITASSIEYEQNISNMVTNVFTNTKINVYVYMSNNINAFTIPGSNIIEKSPLLLRIISIVNNSTFIMNFLMVSLFKFTYLIGRYLITFAMIVEKLLYAQDLNNKRLSIDSMSINPITHKITINIPEATIFISSGLLKICKTDRELIAIILHEVGHNINVYYDIIEETIYNSIHVSGIIFMWNYIKRVEDHYDLLKVSISYLILSYIVIHTFMIIAKYISSRVELSCDEFAIKCGYGNDLYNILDRVNGIYDYITKIYNSVNINNNTNIIGNIINMISKSISYIVNIFKKYILNGNMIDVNYYKDNRLQIIKDKTNALLTTG